MTTPRGPRESQPTDEPGWWQASDFKWYPPESSPGYAPPPDPAPAMSAAAAGAPAAPHPASSTQAPPFVAPVKVCPNCQVQSQTTADKCPNCGKRYKKRKKWPWILLTLFVIFGGCTA